MVYSTTNQSPTLNDQVAYSSSNENVFTTVITGMDASKTYYVRAFASNASGVNYGETVNVIVMGVSCSTSSVTDASGNTYQTVQIKDQCWMKTNLRTTKYADGSNVPTCDANSMFYYRNVLADPTRMGYAYTWQAAMNGASGSSQEAVQGICPNGWHLPSRQEYQALLDNVNGDLYALKDASSVWTDGYTNNTNISGMSILPSGYLRTGCSSNTGGNGSSFEWLSATQYNDANFYYFSTNGITYQAKSDWMGAVRCLKGQGNAIGLATIRTDTVTFTADNVMRVSATVLNTGGEITEKGIVYSATHTTPTYSQDTRVSSSSTSNTFSISRTIYPVNTYYVRAYVKNNAGVSYGDVKQVKLMNTACNVGSKTYMGVTYNTVQIGGQCWMKQNLRATNNLYYALEIDENEDGVPEYLVDSYSYVYWNHNSNEMNHCVYYGADAAAPLHVSINPSGVQGQCPQGWHIPSKAEADQLIAFLGGASQAGAKMKAAGQWSGANVTGESGLDMVRTGYYKSETSSFVYGSTNGYFWVTDVVANSARVLGVSTDATATYFNRALDDQCPIRCLQDPVAFSNIHATLTSGSYSTCTYTYTVTANVDCSNLTRWTGVTAVEVGLEGENGVRFVSSSTSSLNTVVNFRDFQNYKYKLYVKGSDGKYYYGSADFLQGCAIN